MTFRQVLQIIAQRWYIVVITLVLVLLVAYGYLHQQTPSYTSTATVRLNAIGDNNAFSAISLDVDSETITAPIVLDTAARRLGLPEGALDGEVTTSVTEGTQTDRVGISASARSPQDSQRHANAVANAWIQYLKDQISTARTGLVERQKSTSDQISALEKQVQAHKTDQVAQTNLTSAIATLGQINSQITALDTAGEPATLLGNASSATRNGTSVATVFLVAALAGLIAGLGAALVRDQFDGRIRDESDAIEVTDAPLLGELAVERRRRKNDGTLPAAARQPTGFSEGVRALRTSLQVLLPASHAALVLTSPEPGDGKTFVAANLAVSWSRTGRRVILVGGDLRRPGLGVYFGAAADGRGLADLLLTAQEQETAPKRGAVQSLLRNTDFDGLRILPAGDPAAEPADLLGNNALGDIISFLREEADVVLIDSPPTLAMADATILAPRADGVAVLATPRRTRRAPLEETVRVLGANGATVLGVVINRSRRRLPKSYRAYYSGQTPDQKRANQKGDAASSTSGANGRTPKTTPKTAGPAKPVDDERMESPGRRQAGDAPSRRTS